MARRSRIQTPYATIIALVIVAGYYWLNSGSAPQPGFVGTDAPAARAPRFVAGEMVEAAGVVERVLSDDNDGSRHQRFILRLADGRTLLVAHNIDLAPRIDDLDAGDRVAFRGQYETNDRGGVIHWTHHDPRGEHPAGWLEHDGRRYE